MTAFVLRGVLTTPHGGDHDMPAGAKPVDCMRSTWAWLAAMTLVGSCQHRVALKHICVHSRLFLPRCPERSVIGAATLEATPAALRSPSDAPAEAQGAPHPHKCSRSSSSGAWPTLSAPTSALDSPAQGVPATNIRCCMCQSKHADWRHSIGSRCKAV